MLVDELRGATVPVVAVLGNHDYHAGREDEAFFTLVEGLGVVAPAGAADGAAPTA